MWQMPLNFLNGFALGLSRPAILACRSSPAVGGTKSRVRVSPLTAHSLRLPEGAADAERSCDKKGEARSDGRADPTDMPLAP